MPRPLRRPVPHLPLPLRLAQAVKGMWKGYGARVSQDAAEVLVQKTSIARVSQDAAEVLVKKTSIARQSQVAIEVLQQTHHNALVSQVAIEVVQESRTLHGVSFAGHSSLSATVRELHRFTVTFAGHSTLTAGVTTGHGVTRNFNLTLAGTSSLSATVRKLHRFTLSLAGTSSLTVHVGGTDNLIVAFAGVGQLRFGAPGPLDISPVVFAGTSSLHVGFKISVVFAGRSSLTVSLHRVQFVFQIHGLGSLTFFGDLGAPGARLSQITNEVAYVGNPAVLLSQITLEVVRPRWGLHIKARY